MKWLPMRFQITIGKTELEKRIEEAGSNLPMAFEAVFNQSGRAENGWYVGGKEAIALPVLANFPGFDIVGPLPYYPREFINFDPRRENSTSGVSQFQMYLSKEGVFSHSLCWFALERRAYMQRFYNATVYSPNSECSNQLHKIMLGVFISNIIPDHPHWTKEQEPSGRFPRPALVIPATEEMGKFAIETLKERLKKD